MDFPVWCYGNRVNTSSKHSKKRSRELDTVHVLQQEGDIGGYPIPQYRTKNWQIPKYRVENGRNTDTAFTIGVSIWFFFYHYFYLKHAYARNQPQPSRENVRRSGIDRYNDRKARSLDVLLISSQSNCQKLCIHLPLSIKCSKY